MPSLSDTIRRLRSGNLASGPVASPRATPLERLPAFGSNPGALDGWCYVPDGVVDMPLVVVLHGCTQTAAGYDRGAGWSDLAARHGFALLFPEQRQANNPNRCFNWFLAGDIGRDGGEALSIRQMIAYLIEARSIDPQRVFATGLSAGGAMAGVMLATYPELFAGGAIIAGLPYGTASSVPQALERMRGAGLADAAAATARVRAASSHRGSWPAITVWHGDADRTVAVANADAVVAQWRGLHGAGDAPDRVDKIDGQRHRVWCTTGGRVAVEEYRIAGMGHGTPLKVEGVDGCGVAGAYMLDVGISSTWRQAETWGLLRDAPATHTPATADASATETMPVPAGVSLVQPPAPSAATRLASTPPAPAGVQAIIETALRSAGLMK